MREHALPVLTAVAVSLLVALPVDARDDAAVRGEAFAREHCARCHALGPRGASPMREAPPFRTLAGRFPVDDLADVLTEGVDRRHPAMPDFRLGSADASDLTAYLKALRR
ncbi:cytochrome C [Methylobacterium sp. Leaf123]|uniref:c-type cytochrome n=1 Tax=Methylobacterium sp. Leaf123 TaxID=1736264 RepID=UPI0006F8066A|nr:cytochrome c [Methylobacterium sp. Leaf123]KQQ21414.1 cytochrome C [Methylobacterium sp. Leaf123]